MNQPMEKIPPWLELGEDIWANILHRLGAIEILETAQKVCTTWRLICKDPSMWRVINMWDMFDDRRQRKLCRHAVDRSQEREARCTKHLALVRSGKGCTPSSGKLKRLRIAGCSFMIRVGLVEAVQKLPLLEELNLTHTAITTVGIEALGRSCPQLKSFVLNNSLDMGSGHSDKEDERNEKALAIAKNLPTLHHLQLIGNSMTNKGLEAILDGCPHLVSLDLRLCEYISLNEVLSSRISEQIKDVKYPNESLAGLRFSFEAYIWG